MLEHCGEEKAKLEGKDLDLPVDPLLTWMDRLLLSLLPHHKAVLSYSSVFQNTASMALCYSDNVKLLCLVDLV